MTTIQDLENDVCDDSVMWDDKVIMRIFGIDSQATIRSWVKSHQIPAPTRCGRKRYWLPSRVVAFLRQDQVNPVQRKGPGRPPKYPKLELTGTLA
jgi:hypothetical protein